MAAVMCCAAGGEVRATQASRGGKGGFAGDDLVIISDAVLFVVSIVIMYISQQKVSLRKGS